MDASRGLRGAVADAVDFGESASTQNRHTPFQSLAQRPQHGRPPRDWANRPGSRRKRSQNAVHVQKKRRMHKLGWGRVEMCRKVCGVQHFYPDFRLQLSPLP